MENFRVAVKAFTVDGGKVLLVKRREDDVHKPDDWDIPGGRLGMGENPFEGLKREMHEETGIGIDILLPFHVQHFTRDDGQKITMIIFLCRPLSAEVRLSHEHHDHMWVPLQDKNAFPKWLHPAIDAYFRYGLDRFSG
ncbi:MAG: NUDIX domain-containing protein [Candidatus Aenigmarchaeota archaeon]|nr:NUDIX domain-containing protein [Candidatus Aenigmarchaeota archaeon]